MKLSKNLCKSKREKDWREKKKMMTKKKNFTRDLVYFNPVMNK